MSDKSNQALAVIQQFGLKVAGPNGQEFLQFNAAVQSLNQEVGQNEKTILELNKKIAELEKETEGPEE